jgi:hypothetical protein
VADAYDFIIFYHNSSIMSLSYSSSRDTARTHPRSKQKQQQHQYILPKYITASKGLTISRQLTKWIHGGHNLELLTLRGASNNNDRGVDDDDDNNNNDDITIPSQGIGFDDAQEIPPYLIGILQDLILSKRWWKKIEFSGKSSHATERMLESTMILRNGDSSRGRNEKSSSSRRNESRGKVDNRNVNDGRYVHHVDKLVIEHATVRILNSIAEILTAQGDSSLPPSSDEFILCSTTIHHLALRWTEFSAPAVHALSRGFSIDQITPSRHNKPLRGLFLTGSTFTDDALPILAEMLRSCPSLEELSLSDCRLEDDDATTIIRSLFEIPHPGLKSLDLSCNFVQEQSILELARLISERSAMLNDPVNMQQKKTAVSLLSLDISNQDVWDNREYLGPLMEALAGIERSNAETITTIESHTYGRSATAVESIDWSHNFLGDDHLEMLCFCFSRSTMLQNTSNLRKLVLRGNSITDVGLCCISECLPAMLNLQVLDLRLNSKITNDGVATLTNALRQLHKKLPTYDNMDVADLGSDSGVCGRRFSNNGRSLWHIYLDQPTLSFLMQLILHRAGRTRLLWQESNGVTLMIGLWPLILERVKHCLHPEIDSFDEEVCIHGIFQVDLLFELFRLGHPFFLECYH